METYEFYAKPQDGVIPIPDAYKNKITKTVKVIILEHATDSDNETKSVVPEVRKSDLLLPPTIDTRNFKFNREEANER